MSPEESLLHREIRQRRPFRSPQEETFLNLQRTAAMLEQSLARWLKEVSCLTPTQYNALRILRGAHPDALRCSEVGERMVTPVPDVTRLLDRLESAGLVTRCRDTEDRRVVQVAISERGLVQLAELDEPLTEHVRGLLAPLDEAELGSLVSMLERVRAGLG
jgi:DNA-binding MarR family transcriptional regulator